ncbi:MAG: T9SS type A sorting domain-containing protein [Bacteroidia bacterium]
MKTSKYNNRVSYTMQLISIIIFLMLVNFVSQAQGLKNTGAVITINNGVNVTVNGGAGIGNFTNADFGAATGTVENAGEIYVTGDWTNNSAQHVFNASSGAVTLNATTQSINGTTITYFNDLFLGGSSTKTLDVDAWVGGGFSASSGTLSLASSQLDLNTHTLTVTNPLPTAITRNTGFIISETNAAFNPSIVQWNCSVNTGNYVFPFGSSHGYTPVGITKNSADNVSISASTRATINDDNLPLASGVTHLNSPLLGGPGEVPVVIDRWYYVSATSPIDVDIDFTYSGIENTTTYSPTGTFGMQNWTGLWQPPVGSGAGVLTGTATVSAISQTIGPINNNWVLTNILAPLPIQLISFDAKCDGDKKVIVKWQTATEQNLSNYNVERSSDGIHFQTLATVLPQTNFTGTKNYKWTDYNPLSTTAYYRLKENDINGSSTIFKVAAVESCDGKNNETEIYASSSTIYFNMNTSENNNCVIEVFDAAGKKVLNKIMAIENGTNNFQIETTLASGIYFVKYQTGNETGSQKLLLNN